MSNTQQTAEIAQETWQQYKDVFEKLVSEMAPPGMSESGASVAPVGEAELREIVSEVVGAVFLEGNVLEKMIVRSLQNVSEEGAAKISQGLFQEKIKQLCQETFRSMTAQHLLPTLQKQIAVMLAEQINDLGKSAAFKSLIDARFRMMEQYLRSDVIPKVIQKTLGPQ